MTTNLGGRLGLKDPRVPGAILLAMLGFACTPAPDVPRGGIRNNALQDVVVRGKIRGQRYEATLSPGATLWLEGVGDEELEIDVYDASGSGIASDIEIVSYYDQAICRQVVQEGTALYISHYEPDWRKEQARRDEERREREREKEREQEPPTPTTQP